ncbi:Putative major facilitator superfamily, MFS transporter superfamily [Septoria linicola]|uniref:Major facilitator superfamily, MFS transporter superfamily n=1 Tax=Septoria linicola TaxID=215465 RepID=A0A9Q9B882_9PEZI|nr:putative major facilitator superfamily, MFS transporter superfamily [Septoria linicola]USW59203.1 Putative major facilitator superfamily, MFS transporter superfamily [Septoria linicola]
MGHKSSENGAGGASESAEAAGGESPSKTTAQEQVSIAPLENDEEDATQPTSKPRKSLSFHLAFAGLSLRLLVFQMDATCLSIALPAIAGELKGTSLEAFWANLSYSLCGLVMQPVWASVSNAMGTIIAGRVLQGLGGGGIDILVTIVLADMTTLEERSKYIGFMGIATAVGNIMGPFVGALFSTYVSWRWIGWINLPLLGIGGILLVFFLRLRTVPLGATLGSNLSRLNRIGIQLIIAGMTLFCVSISWAGSSFPWESWQTLLPLLLGVSILAGPFWYESKPESPVLPLRLFQTKTGYVALVGGFVHGIILISLLQYLPLFYQAVPLETAISSAVFLLPTLILSVVITVVSMMLVPIFGGYVWLARFSWVIATLGTGLLAFFNTKPSQSMLSGLPILWGQGISLLRILMLPVQTSVKDVNDEGLATANLITIRMFGALVGLAICSPIFNNVFSKSVSDAAVELAGPLASLQDASNAINFISELRPLDVPTITMDQVSNLYLNSFRAIFYTMTAVSALGLVSSVFLDEIKLTRKKRWRPALRGRMITDTNIRMDEPRHTRKATVAETRVEGAAEAS